MTRIDWQRAKERDELRAKPRKVAPVVKGVHPNSTAARKWQRTSWTARP